MDVSTEPAAWKRPQDRSLASVAHELAVSVKTVRRLLAAGAFPRAYRLLGMWRIPSTDVQGLKARLQLKR